MQPEDLKIRPTEWLVQFALTFSDLDDERRWRAVSVLQARADREVFDAAIELCASPEMSCRYLGTNLLGQTVACIKTFQDESVDALLQLLEREREPRVLTGIAYALGHRRASRGVELLAALREHPEENVRYSVVHGLLTQTDPQAVAALIELSSDTVSDVRELATAGLGSMIDVDTPALRDALARRLTDTDDKIRDEGITGLALRQDERVVPLIMRCLNNRRHGYRIQNAVEAFPHPQFLAALESSFTDEDTYWNAWARGVLYTVSAAGTSGQKEGV